MDVRPTSLAAIVGCPVTRSLTETTASLALAIASVRNGTSIAAPARPIASPPTCCAH